MRKKLILLDIVLLGLVLVLGQRLRQIWIEAGKRESVVTGQAVKQLPPPPRPPLAALAPLTAGAYSEIAQKMLFSPDRNPTVVVEVPQRKPMPTLPVFYGLIDLGSGPTAIMSEKSGAKHEEVRFGGQIGEFTLVSIQNGDVELEWEGERVSKRTSDLVEKSAGAGPGQQAQATAAPPPQTQTRQLSPLELAKPGVELVPGKKACQPGDSSPAGAVVDGFRKVERDSPFGKMCEWVPAR